MPYILTIILIIAVLAVIGGFVAMLAVTLPISKKVYNDQLVRTSPEKWGRVCSAPENDEQLAMWNSGVRWAEENSKHCSEVMIENDGYRLYGE